MVSIEYSEAIVEVLDILEHSDEAIYNKIPKKLISFWQRNKSNTYKPNLDHSKLLKDMDLREKTKDILAMIYLNYLSNEKQKEEIKYILTKNEEKYQQELKAKYDPDGIFKNKRIESTKQVIQQELPVKIKETGLFKRIINYFKKLFMKKN